MLVKYFDGVTLLYKYAKIEGDPSEYYELVIEDDEEYEVPEGFEKVLETWDGDPISGKGCYYILLRKISPDANTQRLLRFGQGMFQLEEVNDYE